MLEVVVTKYGSPDVIKIQESDIPEPKDEEVLVKVSYCGINFADILSRMGVYPDAPKPPFTLGFEISGIIQKLGPNVSDFKVGDRVLGLSKKGGYSSHCCLTPKFIFKLPDTISLEDAAAIPVTYLTAYFTIIHPGALRAGEDILIHGAAGGVGTAAIQLSKIREAGKIFGTASDSKHQFLQDNDVIPISYSENFVDAIKSQTDGVGVHIVLDPVGGKNLMQSYKCLSSGGRVFTYGISSMAQGKTKNLIQMAKVWLTYPKFDPLKMIGSNKGVHGFYLGSFNDRPALERAYRDLMNWTSEGKIKPIIDRIFKLEEAAEAHHFIQDRKNIGKVLLKA